MSYQQLWALEQRNHGQLEFHSLCGAFSNASSSWFVPQANPPGEGSCSPHYFRRVLILLEKLARCAPWHLFFFLIFFILFQERRTKHFCGFTSATTKIPPTLCPKVEDWAAGCTQQGKREEGARHEVKGLFGGCHGVSHHHHWRERRGKAADADMVEER